MATLQLLKPAIINGTSYTTAQLILTPVSPDRPKHILPKQEPASPVTSTPEYQLDKKTNPKRRIHFSKKALTHPRPQSVTRRNARERNRVKQVNQGFVTLANHVPEHFRSKKMSKVDTLKAAIAYIKDLRKALNESEEGLDAEMDEIQSSCASSPADTQVSSPLPSAVGDDKTTATSAYLAECHSYSPESAYQPNYPYPSSQQYYEHSHNQSQSLQYNPQYQQTQSQPINNSYYQSPIIDFTQSICSPTSSHSSDSGFEASHGNVTPEEDEILEFASWFQ